MAKFCQVTGRKRMVGNNVSHSKRRTKRIFALNLKTKKFWSEEEQRFERRNRGLLHLKYLAKA